MHNNTRPSRGSRVVRPSAFGVGGRGRGGVGLNTLRYNTLGEQYDAGATPHVQKRTCEYDVSTRRAGHSVGLRTEGERNARFEIPPPPPRDSCMGFEGPCLFCLFSIFVVSYLLCFVFALFFALAHGTIPRV